MGGILRVRVAVLPSVKRSSSKTLLAPLKPLLPGMESEIYPWGAKANPSGKSGLTL